MNSRKKKQEDDLTRLNLKVRSTEQISPLEISTWTNKKQFRSTFYDEYHSQWQLFTFGIKNELCSSHLSIASWMFHW